MKYIIAGGTGFVGQYLIDQWLHEGIEISVIGRDKNKIEKLFANKVNAITWEELDAKGLTELKDTALCLNLTGANIAAKRWSKKRKQEILSSRVDSSKTLAKLCAKLGKDSPALFNASAIGIYGLQEIMREGLPPIINEDAFIDTENPPDFLSTIGVEWEKALSLAQQSSVRVLNLRFAVVLGKNGGALAKIALPFYFFIGGPIGSGRQAFSWVSIKDLKRAIDFLMANPEISGPINIVAPECVTQKELAKTLGEVLKKPSFLPTPSVTLKLLLGQMAEELLLKGQHVYPKRLIELGFIFEEPNLKTTLNNIYNNK